MTSQRVEQRRGLESLYAVAACQAPRCARSTLRWVPTATPDLSGALVPFETDRDPDGAMTVEQDFDGVWHARLFRPGVDNPTRARFRLHWLDCADPVWYRQVREAADPRGVLPWASRSRRPRASEAGPCATCQTEPRLDGFPLCVDCLRTAVAGWSAAMAPTVRSWPAELRRVLHVDDLPIGGYGVQP